MKHPPQEPDLVPSNLVVATILGVVVAIAIGCVIAHGIVNWRTDVLAGDPSAPAEQIRGLPAVIHAIETVPFSVQSLGPEANRVAEGWLATYGWVDRGRRVVRVPIDVAFEVYLSSGMSSGMASGPVSRPVSPREPRRGGAP